MLGQRLVSEANGSPGADGVEVTGKQESQVNNPCVLILDIPLHHPAITGHEKCKSQEKTACVCTLR